MVVPCTFAPSPVHWAFDTMEWTDGFAISPQEHDFFKNANERPLEYTLAEYSDAYQYAKLLLKLLDQVTGPSQPGLISFWKLDQPAFSPDEAQQFLQTDKAGVLLHFCLVKLREFITLVEEEPSQEVSLKTIFINSQTLSINKDVQPLLRILYRQGDDFAQQHASYCLAFLVKTASSFTSSSSNQSKTTTHDTLSSLIAWMASRLQSSHSKTDSLSVVTPTLCVLSCCYPARQIFDAHGGIAYLSRHLRLFTSSPLSNDNRPTIQQAYEMCFCLWTMTFDLAQNKSIQISFVRGGTIHALCQLLRMAPREKILRLTLAILANLSQTQTPNQTTYLGEMIAAKAHKYLQQIRQDRPNSTFMSDPDFMDDLETLQTVLNHYAKKMTQWNVYQAELDSGQLQWGMLHTSDFFQRHVHHLEGPKGDFEPIKKLIGILLQNLNTLSEDTDTTLAVCLFDIGEFLRHYPNGRVIAKSLGIREIVLQLLNHPNEEIQKHALLCVSKLLLQNYHSNIIERDR